MKFVNYPHLFLEYYLSNIYSALCDEKYCSAKEILANFEKKGFINKQRLTHTIIKAVKSLSAYPSISDLMPKNIVQTHEQFIYSKQQIREILFPFFEMLSKLEKENDLARNLWRTNIRDCSSQLFGPSDSFLENFSQLHPHPVIIEKTENQLLLTTTECFWGVARVTFDSFTPDNEINFSEPFGALLTCIEVEHSFDENGENCFSFTLLLDLKKSPLPTRSFESDGWLTLSFTCKGAQLDTEMCNYSKRLQLFGCGYCSLLTGSMATLENKERMLGKEVLTNGEKQLLYLTKLFYSLGLCTPQPSLTSSIDYDAFTELLSNHVEFENTINILSCCQTGLSKTLIKTLKQTYEQYEEEDFGFINLAARTLKRYVVVSSRLGYFELTAKYLSDMLLEATEEIPATFLYNAPFDFAIELIEHTVDKELHQLGFTGQFPHYRKKDKIFERFISFVCEENYYHPKTRAIGFDFSVSVAKQITFSKSKTKTDNEDDILGFEIKNAESIKTSYDTKYSKFGGVEARSATATFLYPVDEQSEEKLLEYSSSFIKYIILLFHTATSVIRGKGVPFAYKRIRAYSLIKSKIWGTAFKKLLPLLSVCLSASIIALYKASSPTFFNAAYLFGGSLVIYLISAVFYCLFKIFGTWRHK